MRVPFALPRSSTRTTRATWRRACSRETEESSTRIDASGARPNVNVPSSGSMWVVTFCPVPIIRRRGLGRASSAPLSFETRVLSTSDPGSPLIPLAQRHRRLRISGKGLFSQFGQIAQPASARTAAIRPGTGGTSAANPVCMLTNLARRSRSALLAATTLCAASCAELGPDAGDAQDDAVMSENGFSMNGFSMNGFSMNGFSMNGFSMNGFSMNGFSMNGFSMNGLAYNGFSMNGFSMNGLETAGGISSTSGLMTTPGGREVVRYMVKCAYPAGHSLTQQDNMVPPNTYTFDGGLGVAPELEAGTCDPTCQERISGCMLAHVNNSGLHVGIWLVGPDAGIGWGYSPNYPYKEAAYFGNLFQNMSGYYCAGKDMASGNAKGRLGSPFGNNGNVLKAIYGDELDLVSVQNARENCVSKNSCTIMNEGYSQCADTTGTQGHPYWTHPVAVWRNFESTQLYKICNKAGNRCLGVVGGSTAEGANVEVRSFTAAAGQTWQILQVNP